jgi:hypothetical protein
MTLLDALSAAADEVTRDLAPGSVELRLRGRNPNFVVTLPATEPIGGTEDVSTTVGGAADNDLLFAEDGPAARINVRMPEQLKSAIEEAAAKEGRSVNAWLVRSAAAALKGPDREQRPVPRGSGKRSKQAVVGDVRVRSANGAIGIGRAGAGVDVKTSNGSIRLGEVVRGSVVLGTAAGDLDIGVAEGTAAWLEVNTFYGQVRNLLADASRPEEGDKTVEVRGRTSYGDITIHRS